MFGVLLTKSKFCSSTSLLFFIKSIAKTDSCLTLNKLRTVSIDAKQIRRLSDRRYSDKHEWLTLDSATSVGTVGVSHYAQEALGDVVYVQLPDVHNFYSKNHECGAVESVKAASEIYTPVSGKVVAVNRDLEDKPGLVNSSCYENGWLFKIKLDKIEEYDQLMNENDYQKYLKSIKDDDD